MPTRRAFTLIELLVVIAIIALLIGILLPTLANARQSARAVVCQSTMRQLVIAATGYTDDHNGLMITYGTGDGAANDDHASEWLRTLRPYYDAHTRNFSREGTGETGEQTDIVARSPLDTSPHWPAELGGDGQPLPSTTDKFRRTSYGINDDLAFDDGGRQRRLTSIIRPTDTVQFVIINFTDRENAANDHVHSLNWFNPNLPLLSVQFAAFDVQLNAVSGRPGIPVRTANEMTSSTEAARSAERVSQTAVSNWAYADGHVAAQPFEEIYSIETDRSRWEFINGFTLDPATVFRTNKMDPAVAR